MEIWKDIKEYEGYYQVSNLGNIRSVDRIVKQSDGSIGHYKGRVLKGEIDKRGYKRVRLSKNNKTKKFQIHRLVAIAFIPNNDINKKFVNHIDENPSNNNVNNLEWVTGSENMRHGTIQQRLADLKKKKIICLNDNKKFNSINEAANYYKIDRRLISGVLHKDKKTTYGKVFVFDERG